MLLFLEDPPGGGGKGEAQREGASPSPAFLPYGLGKEQVRTVLPATPLPSGQGDSTGKKGENIILWTLVPETLEVQPAGCAFPSRFTEITST